MTFHKVLVVAVAALALSGCGGEEGDGASAGGPGKPPPRITTQPPCVISADCPAAQHCDLGECIQDCNVDSACRAGLSCSARARCLTPKQLDKDPDPVTERVGTIKAEPASTLLTDRDKALPIRLTTDSAKPVRYRIQMNAPHLSINAVRGEFKTSTDLAFVVDAARLQGKDVPGTIKIFTNLGNVVVDAPIKVGVTGTYQGSMSYAGSGIALGSAQLVVDVRENNGDVTVSVDAARSLLFPEAGGKPIAGRGIFTISEGVEFSLKQVLPKDFGGTANHFARPIGRDLRFRLKPSDRGTLQGTFEETIFGLFEQPITLKGTAYFEHKPLERDVTFEVPPDPVMPTVSASSIPEVTAVFPGWTNEACYTTPASTCGDALKCAPIIDQGYYGPLASALSRALPAVADPLGDIATNCAQDLQKTDPTAPFTCALVPPLACALYKLGNTGGVTLPAKTAFGSLYAHTLDPALLVPQDRIVKGVKDSFLNGSQAQVTHLDAARNALQAPATWVLHPGLLDYLRRIAEDPATTPAPGTNGEAPHQLALRTLARLFVVLSTIDGEASRISASDRARTQAERVSRAQQRAVLTLLEAATILGVLDGWKMSAPGGVGVEFLGVLTPMDSGFGSLVQGALQFGVPEGFIPYLFDPKAVKTTNFEQVLDSVQSKITQQSDDETAFSGTTREFEQNKDGLARELEQVRLGMDSQLEDLCGASFDVTSVMSDTDWQRCGVISGEVRALRVNIDQAHERLRAAQSRISGMRDKIAIEDARMKQVKEVREGTIRLVQSTGAQLEALVFAEGFISAFQKLLEVSANSQVLNFGAPTAMGAVAAVYELQRTQIQAERQRLQTAQEVRIHADNARVEVINGMAVIKSMLIDMGQLQVESAQDVLGELQANIDIGNALEKAKRLAKERQQVLARITKSPFNDPTFRVLQTRSALQSIRSRSEAQRGLYLAGRALEYQLNQPFGDAIGQAVLNAYNAQEIGRLKNCLDSIFQDSRLVLGAAQDYSTEFSVRERLGITAPRTDEVTGEKLTEGALFRQALLRNENLDGSGGVGIEFSSNLEPGNELWPSNVCDDKITTIEAQLVGDFLGNNEAQVQLLLQGGGLLRRCDRDELINWSAAGNAAIQAGVNSFGTAPSPNSSLHGLSVASSLWKVVIPGKASAPSNSDVDLQKVEDIVLRVRHQARPIRSTPVQVSLACLATIGAGR